MISSTASTPKLTDEGGPNIFRMAGRDDQIAPVAGQLLADRWGDAQIAIVHDGQAYGKGLAEKVKTQAPMARNGAKPPRTCSIPSWTWPSA